MFEALDAIPVKFDPSWVDERMLWLTGGSIIVSAVLGWLAYWNGRKATRIAREAADREERRRIDEERSKVALSMIRAINAVASASAKPRERKSGTRWGKSKPNPLHSDTRFEEDKRVAEAKALVTLLVPESSPVNARDWFSHMVEHFRGLTTPERHEDFNKRRDALFSLIAKWNKDPSSLNEMLAFDFEGALTRKKDRWCKGNNSAAKANPR